MLKNNDNQKRNKKKSIWLITDEKNLPIKEKRFRSIVRKKNFPNNFIFKFDENFFISLHLINSSTLLEFNHNLTWVGVKLFNYCVSGDYEIVNPEVIDKPENIYLGWCLGNYEFLRFKSKSREKKEVKLSDIKNSLPLKNLLDHGFVSKCNYIDYH